MSANKANGIDGIKPCSLKAGVPLIYDSLAFIMNLCISTGLLTNGINGGKIAKVIPMYKSGNASEVSNY